MKGRTIHYILTCGLAASMLTGRGAVPAAVSPGAIHPKTFRGPVPAVMAAAPVRQDTLLQGIEGTVYRVSGNHMPDPHHPAGPPAGVRSTVYIFELTNIGRVIRQGTSPYYTSVGSRFVKQADTDEKGHFRVGLPPGSYSLFTKKGDLYYASRMDDKNNIAPVEVVPGKMTPVECRVEFDHKAVY